MNENSETTVAVVEEVQVAEAPAEKQGFDYEPVKQYVTGAVRDNGTLKIQTVVMPNVLYAKVRDHLSGFGFKRHPRNRYFFAPVTPETEAVALNLVESITDAPVVVTATPATPQAEPLAKPTRKVTPAPKPTGKPKRAPKATPKATPKVNVDDAWVEDIPMA